MNRITSRPVTSCPLALLLSILMLALSACAPRAALQPATAQAPAQTAAAKASPQPERPSSSVAAKALLPGASFPQQAAKHAAPIGGVQSSAHRAAPAALGSKGAPNSASKAKDSRKAPTQLGPSAAAAAAAASGCPAPGTRVLLIGDSLSHGLGPHMARLAKACGTPFIHHGVVGSHVTQWAQAHWLQPLLRRARPTHVMVSLGGNDFQRTDPHNVQAAIPRFLSQVRAADAELLWIKPPTMPFADTIGVRAMWLENLQERADTHWFATDELVIPRAADRIHPNLRGNLDLSRTLWRWLGDVCMTSA